MKKNLFIAFAFILGIALMSLVSAQIGIPHQFYGDVAYNGAPAPNGVSIVAKIEGVIVAGTSTSDGAYGYNPLFFVTDSDENRDGKTIFFYVNNIEASSYIFGNGKTTELNLAVSGPAIDGGSSGDSGSSSGGGGGGGSSTSSLSSTGEAVNTGSDTNSESSDENQINVGGGMTGGVIGFAKTGTGIGIIIVLIIVLVGILGYFGLKKRPRKQ